MPEPVSLVSAIDDFPDPRRTQGLDHGFTDLLEIAVVTLRVGDHRVICQLEDDRLLVLVVRIAHRSEAYD